MSYIVSTPNRDLQILDGKSHWCHADFRRHGFHNLHNIARYSISLRSAYVMSLEKRADLRIAELESVRHLTGLPWFSAMIVIRGQYILFERYAADFGKDRAHSIQSITKTIMNLVVGRLVDEGILDLSRPIGYYVPEVGSGYARATLQQVMNMDVVNDYSQDFSDPQATYYRHEEAMGWRLPLEPDHEETQRGFISRIAGGDRVNDSGNADYKDANPDVVAWVAERASGVSMRSFLADIVDAAGLEGALHITTDREGMPAVDGGGCLSARDLARYLAIFVRRGHGINGTAVGSETLINQTLASGIPMPPPREWIRYSNHTMVIGRSLGHSGWGGQYAMANLDTGVIGVFFSVIENQHAINGDYLGPVIRMLESITSMES